MRITPSFLAASLAALLLPAMAQGQLLDDGDFSNATSGSTTSGSDWSLDINLPDTTNRAAQFQTGFANAQNTGVGGPQSPGTGAGVWFRAFEGAQDPGQDPAQATLTQSILAPSTSDYRLDFVAGRETFFTADAFSVTLEANLAGSVSVDLLAASIPDGNLGGGSSGNPGGTPFILKLTGVTAGETITVTGQMLNGVDVDPESGGQSAFLDSFSLTEVPEPGSALLATLAAFGFLVRRRR